MNDKTLLSHSGRKHAEYPNTVNTPVYRASTILFPSLAEYEARKNNQGKYYGVRYGAYGTTSTFALTETIADLEGLKKPTVAAVSSGQAAANLTLLACLKTGDHLLMTLSAYGPTREFCKQTLSKFGIETTFYNPNTTFKDLEKLFKANTKVIFTESPGSLTFDMQDIPAITKLAHKKNVLVLVDNTWATSLYFKAFNYDVDFSIQAATKYIAGHSDVVLGLISARTEELFFLLKDTLLDIGEYVSPDECTLTLRGLRSMAPRMEAIQKNALEVAIWLEKRPEVSKVLYPQLPSHAGHEIWKRDFTGGGGVFSVLLPKSSSEAISAMIDNYELFGIGASWGGYESLVLPGKSPIVPENISLIRYSIGLEDPKDLIEDLEKGFERFNKIR